MGLRAAAVTDLASIEALLRRCGLPVDGAAEHLPSFVVAVGASRLVACGGVEYYGDVALMRSVAVDQAARAAGLGKTIVSRLLDDCRSRGVLTVALLTTSADDYFARRGFVKVTREDVPAPLLASSQFRGVCPDSAIVMLKSLEPRAVKSGGETEHFRTISVRQRLKCRPAR